MRNNLFLSRRDAEAQRIAESLFEHLSFSLEIFDIIHRLLVNNIRHLTTALRTLRLCVSARKYHNLLLGY